MNLKEAFEIMELNHSNICYNEINIALLKKQYRKLALLNHPDKCGNTEESTQKFQKIQEAYQYLQKELKQYEQFNTNNFTETKEEKYESESETSSLYMDILKVFMKTILERNYNDIVLNIVTEIVYGCKKVSLRLFDNIDKETCTYIYNFLSNHRSILHLSQELLETIHQMVLNKYDNALVYKLNPNIDDLMDNNIYKLYVKDNLYIVPLWHNEVYFDTSDNEIIVICEPGLKENIKIDDDNNIHVETHVSISVQNISNLILENKSIEIHVGKKEFFIPISELYMKREQYYRIKNKGISQIKNDIYDISERADIIVKIIFDLFDI